MISSGQEQALFGFVTGKDEQNETSSFVSFMRMVMYKVSRQEISVKCKVAGWV